MEKCRETGAARRRPLHGGWYRDHYSKPPGGTQRERRWGIVKISRLEWAALLLAAAAAAFAAGWFLRGQADPQPVRVETQRVLVQETPIALPSPTPAEAESSAPAGLVNLNTADAEELMTLPGIGETRAADIIAYRQANGPFRMVEQLTDVPGIGEGILVGLIDYVTIE